MGWGRSNCSVVICDGEDICGRFDYSSIDMTCLLIVAFSLCTAPAFLFL